MKKYLFIVLVCLLNTFLIAEKTENKDWLTLYRENKVLNKEIIKLQGIIKVTEEKIIKIAIERTSLRKEIRQLKTDNDKLQSELFAIRKENQQLKSNLIMNDTELPFIPIKKIFGVFLGESIDRLSRRLQVTETSFEFKDKNHPGKIWNVDCKNQDIKYVHVHTYNSYVYLIDIRFKDTNLFSTICKQLTMTYKDFHEYGEANINNDVFVHWNGKFDTNVKGEDIDVLIRLDFEFDFIDNDLSTLDLIYVHTSLRGMVNDEIEKRKFEKVDGKL